MTDKKPGECFPCPFCGEIPTVGDVWVECQANNCYVKPSTPYCKTQKDAIEMWNKRKAEPE